MRKLLKTSVLLLVATSLIVGSIAFAQDGDPQPEIVIPKLRYDFGKVFEQDEYAYTFLVRNRGKADLVIADVKPG